MFVFSHFSHIMRIHVSHALGIIWTFASLEIFKKPINLKCLCFPKLFWYYGNPLFLCFENCMNFCFIRKIVKTLNFEMFVFFPYYRNSLFPYFGNCMDFCFTYNIWEIHNSGMFVFFPYFLHIMGIHFSHILGTVWVSASPKIFQKPINLKCLCFPMLFSYYVNPLFPYFWNCMDFYYKQKI